MAFDKTNLAPSQTARSSDVLQVINALDGTANYGQPITLNKLNSNSAYALDVQNLGTGGGLRVKSTAGNTVLDVTDSGVAFTLAAITVPSSAGAAPTGEGVMEWDSDDDLLKVGTGAATRVMVDTVATQTLTNKTLTAPSLTNPSLTTVTVTAGGITVAGSPSGYTDEFRFGGTGAAGTYGLATQATGAPTMFFDHRGAANTGGWSWRNNGVTSTRMSLSADGVLTVAAATATPAGGSTTARLVFGTTVGFGIYYGSGVPTVSAAQGSLYLRSDGSSTTTRAYINTDGGTTWTAVSTVG